MERIAATFLLLALIAGPAIDAVSCPDGCTDGPYPVASLELASTHVPCALCTNGTVAVPPTVIWSPVTYVMRVPAPLADTLMSAALAPIYRPPRQA